MAPFALQQKKYEKVRAFVLDAHLAPSRSLPPGDRFSLRVAWPQQLLFASCLQFYIWKQIVMLRVCKVVRGAAGLIAGWFLNTHLQIVFDAVVCVWCRWSGDMNVLVDNGDGGWWWWAVYVHRSSTIANIYRCFYIVNSIWFHRPFYNVHARQIRLCVPLRFRTLTLFFVVYGSHSSTARSVAIIHFLAPVNSRLVFGFGVGLGSVTLSHARSQQATAIYIMTCPTLAAKSIIDIVVAFVYMCVCVNACCDDARCSNR